MRTVFGPVPSQRLGRSLGIDPIPFKTCNWNCVYCQLGRTRPLTNTRREYISRQDILIDVRRALDAAQPGEIDWLTFTGAGEPTLHSGLGWLIRQVKLISDLPVAVITNGATLSLPDVRFDLAAADAVLPTLDAGEASLYRKINRAWPNLKFEAHLQGLAAFRRIYSGHLWVQTMLLKELNDTRPALLDLARSLNEIHPDLVHLTLPTRPAVESWVQPASPDSLHLAQVILGEISQVSHSKISPSPPPRNGALEGLIMGIITRHPMRFDELYTTLGCNSEDGLKSTLDKLTSTGQAQRVVRYNQEFWCAAAGWYERTPELAPA